MRMSVGSWWQKLYMCQPCCLSKQDVQMVGCCADFGNSGWGFGETLRKVHVSAIVFVQGGAILDC
ncbi:hypothetical protein DEO72_LG1g1735 [Vigna unguiculata]|uniref:Uncharacterized protein n=1 Tax=Vigna unguiculata TaxID=3917 RepID=A0A4D6KJI7_VIGUN|nr:hypothetical protein DEO72_LG1g1735 [Vigna unguiculata]